MHPVELFILQALLENDGMDTVEQLLLGRERAIELELVPLAAIKNISLFYKFNLLRSHLGMQLNFLIVKLVEFHAVGLRGLLVFRHIKLVLRNGASGVGLGVCTLDCRSEHRAQLTLLASNFSNGTCI